MEQKQPEVIERDELAEIGARLHALRFRARMSLEAVEDATGIGSSSLSKWERGLVEAGILSILKLCSYYEVDPDWLLSDLGTKRVFSQEEAQRWDLITGEGRGIPRPPGQMRLDIR